MKETTRCDFVWRTLCPVVRWPLRWIFAFSQKNYALDTPTLVVSNHVTNYDPLLVAICFPKHHMHFVASEHLFRKGWMSRAIKYLVAPIARRKGSAGTDAAMAILRRIRAGRSVCLFAEGETTWNGRNNPIFPATGQLAKASGGTLMTYRLEGGYFTAPRWGKGIRRGRMEGRVVNIYSPETLKTMTSAQVEEAINRDIYEDAWERQKQSPVRYRYKNRASNIETALFMCPSCKRIGTLTGSGDTVRCSCGFAVKLTEYGTFDPPKPFENLLEWDEWQMEQLNAGSFEHGQTLMEDGETELVEILPGHEEKLLGTGSLCADWEGLQCAGKSFAFKEISDMALVQRRKLIFTHQDQYCEIRTKRPACLRKYLALWRKAV